MSRSSGSPRSRARDVIEQPRPRVVISKCLGFEHCRYNGAIVVDRIVETLKPFLEPIPVCPEVEIGLGVPRPPIRRAEHEGRVCLFQPETKRDVTESMDTFADRFFSDLQDVDGFLLKYRSPSCGPSQVRIYHSIEPTAGHRKGAGAFAETAAERFPGLPIEDEGRLQSFELRGHWLTRLFTLARFRRAAAETTMGALVSFHSRQKLLLLSYNQAAMREMGRIVANAQRRPIDEVLRLYRVQLTRALDRAPRRRTAIDVLQHAFGYVSDRLEPQERAHFQRALEAYEASRIPLAALTVLLGSWIARFDVRYLADQTYFEPYPADLIRVLDSGKGRAL
jgi:uncharacterized protein YbgA (DUF1722 family)/uncharacterized protein YbbK (DUF523 family)